MAKASLQGSFTSATTGSSVALSGSFNVTITGTFVGTILLERSFDNETFSPITQDFAGTPVQITGPISVVAYEPENSVRYRLRCSAYTSGTANWRLSQ